MQSNTGVSPRVSWIEIAIVVVVLAVLGALVVPQFSQAGSDVRARELQNALQIVQGQIELYRIQHDNVYPDRERFVEQMTLATNGRGQCAIPGTDGFEFGPYLRRVPVNPYTSGNDIGNGPAASSSWFFDEASGRFKANHQAAP